jgi:hypothetical protein
MKSLGIALAIAALTSCTNETTREEPAKPCDKNIVGNICTVAGSLENGYDQNADTQPIDALKARFSLPQDTLTAPDGTMYILDWNNHRIRSLEKDGKIHWIAGRGELGGDIDDPANGDFNHPTNIIFDKTGQNLIIAAWHNSKIRTLSLTTKTVVDTCGNGARQYFGDDGPALTCSLDLPASVVLNPKGELVIMDQANQVIRYIDAAGNIHKLAGKCLIDDPPPSGPGPCAMPVQCAAGPNGPSGKWTCGDPTKCTKCNPGYGGDEGPATEMRMSQPFGQAATPAGRMAYDSKGQLYFADTANHLIRMIDTAGVVHRVAGQPPKDGVAQHGYAGDGGPAKNALLDYPVDLTFGDDGTLYFSDVYNHCIRAIDPSGNIKTAVGKCTQKGFAGDGAPANAALLKLPYGVEYANGRLNIADTGNMVIRSVKVK